MPSEIRSAALGIFNHLFALAPGQSPDGERQPKLVTLDADAKAELLQRMIGALNAILTNRSVQLVLLRAPNPKDAVEDGAPEPR